jgi:acid phosphatase (class A)
MCFIAIAVVFALVSSPMAVAASQAGPAKPTTQASTQTPAQAVAQLATQASKTNEKTVVAPGWVTLSPEELRAILPQAPAEGTPAAQADLDTVRLLQMIRTPALIEEGVADAPRGPAAWAQHVLGEAFDPARLPQTVALLEAIHEDIRIVNRNANAAWGERPRPAKRDSRIVPSLPNAIDGPAYPSARTAATRVWAEVLAELFPAHADALRAAAERSAWLRLIGGAHDPAELEGGRIVGDAFLRRLHAHSAYRDALLDAIDEIAAQSQRHR